MRKSKGKPDDLPRKGSLSVRELEMGKLEVVKLVQKQVFARELEALNDLSGFDALQDSQVNGKCKDIIFTSVVSRSG